MLLDTNVLIDVLRKRSGALSFISSLPKMPAISVVSVMELFSGARSRKEENHISALLDSSKVLPMTREIGQRAGVFLKHYRASHGIDDPDAIIAATAEHHALELATLNLKHYPMFPRLKAPY